MAAEIDPKLLEDPLFQRVMKDALEMQNRFSAEPVYAKTGKGYLESEGVAPLQRVKEAAKRYRESK
jgi:hypothetical protein